MEPGLLIHPAMQTETHSVIRKREGRLRPSLFFTYLLAALLPACTSLPEPAHKVTAMPGNTTALSGLRASQEDQSEPYIKEGIEHLRWSTYWNVTWEPVLGAKEYILTVKTSEGVSKKPIHLKQTAYRLEVAKGDNPKHMEMFNRKLQLLTIQGMLAVRITPLLADGNFGEPSPWLQAGLPYPEPAHVSIETPAVQRK
jgi:hypothetical protein